MYRLNHMEETVCTPVFSDPYGVYLPEDRLQELDLKSGNPVELTFDVDGEEKTILAKVDFRENFNMQKETHALFYGIAQTIHDLPSEGFEKSFGKFKGEKLYEIEIDTYGKLNDYLELVKTQKSRIGEEDLLIGCGFFELFLKGNREIKNLIETPLFKIDKPTFDELLISPPLLSVKKPRTRRKNGLPSHFSISPAIDPASPPTFSPFPFETSFPIF
ncbi:hypothetical protein AKJ62_02795 [candidate division MSBL1 archaeon SCGC-AAA259D14]|uniref:Uncharacterized protein n=1 Tax=candidate division MSBL1 archaeon SCGC-AAA259D14 TaxID=1698261 RepID=A0A133U5X1_9EURY|nr:hypothetical protein AKJ62_02795 [candidate division MSBL1 archaeon SCGC-AAA259D14]